MESVAVDFGTTSTCCCRWTDSGPELIALLDDQGSATELPSAIFFEDISFHDNPQYLIGHEAAFAGREKNASVYYSFQKILGSTEPLTIVDAKGNRGLYQASELVTFFLIRLFQRVRISVDDELNYIDFIYPAAFSAPQIDELRASFKRAIASVHQNKAPILGEMIDSTSAAAIAYIWDESRGLALDQPNLGLPQTLLSMDFGGGSSNASLCIVNASHEEERLTAEHSPTIEIILRTAGGLRSFCGDLLTAYVTDQIGQMVFGPEKVDQNLSGPNCKNSNEVCRENYFTLWEVAEDTIQTYSRSAAPRDIDLHEPIQRLCREGRLKSWSEETANFSNHSTEGIPLIMRGDLIHDFSTQGGSSAVRLVKGLVTAGLREVEMPQRIVVSGRNSQLPEVKELLRHGELVKVPQDLVFVTEHIREMPARGAIIARCAGQSMRGTPKIIFKGNMGRAFYSIGIINGTGDQYWEVFHRNVAPESRSASFKWRASGTHTSFGVTRRSAGSPRSALEHLATFTLDLDKLLEIEQRKINRECTEFMLKANMILQKLTATTREAIPKLGFSINSNCVEQRRILVGLQRCIQKVFEDGIVQTNHLHEFIKNTGIETTAAVYSWKVFVRENLSGVGRRYHEAGGDDPILKDLFDWMGDYYNQSENLLVSCRSLQLLSRCILALAEGNAQELALNFRMERNRSISGFLRLSVADGTAAEFGPLEVPQISESFLKEGMIREHGPGMLRAFPH